MKRLRNQSHRGFAQQVDSADTVPGCETIQMNENGPSVLSSTADNQQQIYGTESNYAEDVGGDKSSIVFEEPVPATVFYRSGSGDGRGNRTRPTIYDLGSPFFDPPSSASDDQKHKQPFNQPRTDSVDSQGTNYVHRPHRTPVKFGWVQGVLVRCLLNIWGVILFVRLTWLVGQAGIGLATCVILLGSAVTTITALSLSAICTNGEVKAGGAYYLISRSLGPEFGGAIGLIFSFANVVAVALYVAAFGETVWDLMHEHDWQITGEHGDIRIVGVITLTLLLGIALIGSSWEAKVQLVLLVILVAAILTFFIGALIGPTNDNDIAMGFTGFSGSNLVSNWAPGFVNQDFLSVFAIFFPSATGILAGANMSGDLRDPSHAIPKGTLTAIGITSAVYFLMAWTAGVCMERIVVDVQATTVANNGTVVYRNDAGLLYDYNAAALMSAWPPLVLAGIFSASLSSALVCLVSAPRIFQAVCQDHLFPYLDYFAVGSGPDNDPRRAYLLAYGISIVIVLIGELNTIAPVLSNFFLMSYALINYSCFSASISRSPGWRPSFRWYNEWVALAGAGMCVLIMFLNNWLGALLTLFLVLLIYKYVEWKKPDVNWGSSMQAKVYVKAMQEMLRLDKTVDHVKTFRPQLLVMTGPLNQRGDLVRLSDQLVGGVGLVLAVWVVVGDFEKLARQSGGTRCEMTKSLDPNLQRVKMFTETVVAPSVQQGLRSVAMAGGLGKMRPNTVVVGFKYNWQKNRDEVDSYVGMLSDAFEVHCGVLVVRGNHDSDSGAVSLPFYQLRPVTTIDVWWLVDDGGLTLLLPYLLSLQKHWSKCRLRVLTQASTGEITDEEMRMTRLLLKFRIQAEVIVLSTLDQQPNEETQSQFRQLNVVEPGAPLSEKTLRQLRLRELLLQYSDQAAIIFLSMPFPRRTEASLLYMAWLESLTAGLPPCVLIRGNQQSVLTFYS